MKSNENNQERTLDITALSREEAICENKEITVDTSAGSMSYNRFEMQVSQALHLAIELYDSLDYLLVMDYYDDITLFEDEKNPEIVSYYQMKNLSVLVRQ